MIEIFAYFVATLVTLATLGGLLRSAIWFARRGRHKRLAWRINQRKRILP